MIFASLTILALLLAFHHVVRGAVQQGQLLRSAAATHADATWRCNALNGSRKRDSCLVQLNGTPHDDVMLQGRTVAAITTVSAVSPVVPIRR